MVSCQTTNNNGNLQPDNAAALSVSCVRQPITAHFQPTVLWLHYCIITLTMKWICTMIFQCSQEAMYTASKCFYMYVSWRWPMWVKICCFNKHQNLVLLTVVIIHSYHTVTWWEVHLTVIDVLVLWNMAEHSKVFKAKFVVYI